MHKNSQIFCNVYLLPACTFCTNIIFEKMKICFMTVRQKRAREEPNILVRRDIVDAASLYNKWKTQLNCEPNFERARKF